MNIFDVVGPVMVGPSSSHTAGAVKIGYISRKLLGEQPVSARILLYGSFLTTGKGHGTRKALVAGLLGMQPDDARIPQALTLAEERGMQIEFGEAQLKEAHPNTAQLYLQGQEGRSLEIIGQSLGGSRINIAEIDGIETNFSGDYPTLVVHNQDQPGHVAEVTSMLSHKGVNIAYMQLYRSSRGGEAVMVVECDQEIPKEGIDWLKKVEGVKKVTYLGHDTEAMDNCKMITYHSIQDILELCEKEQMTFAQVIERADMEERAVTQEASYAKMQSMYEAMRHADATYDAKLTSASGLVGGDGEKLRAYNEAGKNLCGDFLGLVMEKAIKMAEGNACMRRIVAAPTAGSCGVIPAVFLTAQEKLACTEEQMVAAMYISAGVGAVIAENASIAGASGGCQAEIGSASAMAAAGLCFLQGGTNAMIANAAALALKNMLGLACDPVCGLVEVPCVKRNVAGAVNAVSAAQLSLAGIKSAIPVDEVIDAMRRIGNEMSPNIKETGQGGLATTPTAIQIGKSL